MTKRHRRASASEIKRVRDLVCRMYPHTFCPRGVEKPPLQLDIVRELRAELGVTNPEISYRMITAFMIDYQSGIRYLRNLLAGAPRYDLDGNPSGYVTRTEAAAAQHRLQKREAWIENMKRKHRGETDVRQA